MAQFELAWITRFYGNAAEAGQALVDLQGINDNQLPPWRTRILRDPGGNEAPVGEPFQTQDGYTEVDGTPVTFGLSPDQLNAIQLGNSHAVTIRIALTDNTATRLTDFKKFPNWNTLVIGEVQAIDGSIVL